MFDKALSSLLGATLLCAAAALAVFAAGFALYALLLAPLGAAGAAASVAAAAAAAVGIGGLIYRFRAAQREVERVRMQAAAQTEFASLIPEPVRELMRRHPLAAVAVSVVGGVLAARNPRIVREVITALRAAPRD